MADLKSTFKRFLRSELLGDVVSFDPFIHEIKTC